MPAAIAGETPVLRDIAALRAGENDPSGIIRRRLDRRYARIRVVYTELSKLDFKKVKPGAGLDDFVFEQTDFDIYKKISRDDFTLFFTEGLDDFDDAFYKNNFRMDRGAIKKTIRRWYRPGDGYYSCGDGDANPLLLGIMRTLHTALDFTPLIQAEETLRECTAIVRFLQSQSALGAEAMQELAEHFPRLFHGILRGLHQVTVTHADGMVTTLSVPASPSPPVLYGTFRPLNKAHTIPLSSATGE